MAEDSLGYQQVDAREGDVDGDDVGQEEGLDTVRHDREVEDWRGMLAPEQRRVDHVCVEARDETGGEGKQANKGEEDEDCASGDEKN